MRAKVSLMAGNTAPRQNSSMHLGMERLDAPLQDLREAGQVRHTAGLYLGIPKHTKRVSGGEQLPPKRVESLGQLRQTCLVPNAQYSSHVTLTQ